MKRIASLLLILVMLFVFVACDTAEPAEPEEPTAEEPEEPPAEEPETPEEEPEAEPADDKTTIKFAVQADSTDALNQIVAAFNEKSENYQVEAIIMTNDSGQMHDQLLNTLSSKSGEYDVISMDVVWAGEFAAAGYLDPIDELIQDNGWLPTDFNKGSMDSGKYAGKNYVLPYFPDLGFLFVRTDIVSEEDLATLQSGDYTYDDLLAMAEMYQGEANTEYGYVFQAKQYEGLVVNLNEFTANWADIEGGLSTMKAYMDAGILPDDILNYDEGATHTAFLNGEAVFGRNWPYMNGMIAAGDQEVTSDQVDFAPLPAGGSVGGWILGINAAGQNKEGAEEFLSFVAGPEGQKINATVGSYLPGYNELLEDADVQASNALLTNPGFTKALEMTIARPVVANYAEVSDQIQLLTHSFLSGNSELEEAVSGIEAVLE